MDENEGRDLPSEAGLIGRESSNEDGKEEMSELEFDSNPPEDRPWEDQEPGGGGGGGGVEESDEEDEEEM